jgi:hypothetical protein
MSLEIRQHEELFPINQYFHYLHLEGVSWFSRFSNISTRNSDDKIRFSVVDLVVELLYFLEIGSRMEL